MRWLVTGAEGQLGRSARAVAAELGLDLVGLGRAELDVTDPDAIARALDRVQPDAVLNCAAFTDVDRCEAEEAAAEALNGRAPGLLAAACRGRALLVHLSTDYLFAGDGCEPIPEEAEPRPLSAYGRSKLHGEQAVRESGCEHLIVRSQWLFGPGRNFVRTILGAAQRGEALRVVADQVGHPTWTVPLARALFRAVALGARATLHLACEGEASWHEFASEIVAQGARRGLTRSVEVRAVSTAEFPRPARRPAYGVLALERARGLGVALPHWHEALSAYLTCEREGRDA